MTPSRRFVNSSNRKIAMPRYYRDKIYKSICPVLTVSLNLQIQDRAKQDESKRYSDSGLDENSYYNRQQERRRAAYGAMVSRKRKNLKL